MQDKNNNNVSLPVVNQSPAPSNGQANPGTNSKVGEKIEKGSLPSLGGFKFETKATDVYKRGIVGKGRDFFQLKENSHVQFSKNEDILHNYFYKYLNEKKAHWMPHLAGEIIINAQGSVAQVSGTEVLLKKKETDGLSKEPVIKGAKRLSSNLKKPGTPLKKLSGEIEFKQVNMLGKSIDQDFHEATSIQKSGRTTLYSTIINTNDNLIKIAESSIQHNDSPTTSMIQQSKFDAKTYIDQTQRSYNSNIKGIYQLNAPLNSSYLIDKYSKKYDINIAKDFASGLYIPLTQRQLKFDNRTKKQRRLNPLTESNQYQVKKKEDESQLNSIKNNQSPFITTKEILEKIKHISPNKQQINKDQHLDIILSHSQTIFQDDQSNLDQTDDIQKGAQTERNQTLQNALHLQLGFLEQDNQNQQEAKLQLKPKRQSFSLCQTKFDDARAAVDMHPLLHAKMKGPILIDLETIYKMKKAKRYPIPEKILHSNDTFQLQIDSIIRQAYDNDEIEFSANQKQEIDAPCNSMESNEKIEFYSSGSDYEIIHDQEITDSNKKQKAKNESDIIQIVKKRKKNKYQTELPPDTKEA